MTLEQLFEQIIQKRSYLCVGLDTDPERIPEHLQNEPDPIFAFNKAIIDATADLCVAYKPNIAFYEALGTKGWEALEKTLDYIPDSHFTIADAKRGDIGNTSKRYAKAFFETLSFDSITVAPYMGHDSVTPFLGFPEKWVILLGLTSNPGSQDFQLQGLQSGGSLYEKVFATARTWAGPGQLMFVAGATQADHFIDIRKAAGEHFLLVPGVGAQGGDLAAISKAGFSSKVGLLVNSSRGIIYAGKGTDFAAAARSAAQALQQEMDQLLQEGGF